MFNSHLKEKDIISFFDSLSKEQSDLLFKIVDNIDYETYCKMPSKIIKIIESSRNDRLKQELEDLKKKVGK